MVAGMSSRSACSIPQASVGNIRMPSEPCSSILESVRLDFGTRGGSARPRRGTGVDSLGDLAPEEQIQTPRTITGSNVGLGRT